MFCFFTPFIFSSRLWAQNAATLDVTIFDPSAAAVRDATAVLQGISTPSDQHPGVSSGDGHYRFDVPPGRYRLIVTHASLQRLDREVALDAGAHSELRVALRLEVMSQSVLVSADATAITATAASEPSTVITREEIDQRQSAQIGPLLGTVSGIAIAQYDSAGGTTSLFIDGGNSNFTKVLVDGVTLNQPGGAISRISPTFTLDDVDKIEVVRGAQSARAASARDAMTGVVDILTHRGSTQTPQLLLEGEGGTFTTGHGMARVSGLSGPLDYSAAAAYFSTAGQQFNIIRYLNRTLNLETSWLRRVNTQDKFPAPHLAQQYQRRRRARPDAF